MGKELEGAKSKVTVEPYSRGVFEVREGSGFTPENIKDPSTVVSAEKTKLNPKQKKKKKHNDVDPLASSNANKSVGKDNVEERGEAIVDTKKLQLTVEKETITPEKTHEQDPSSHPNENEVDPLEVELKDKEAKLHELLTSEVCLVESKGKEMSVLISAVDEVEDKKHAKQKQVAEIDANIRELQISK